MRVAVYSANFGNYRNEMKHIMDYCTFDCKIDYYFFTDNTTITSDKWKIIRQPLLETLDFMDACRHTSKYIKFVVPDILKVYNIIIWIDTKCIHNISFSFEKIIKLCTHNKSMFFMKHAWRKTAHQELDVTINTKREHIENGTAFQTKIKDMFFETHMPDTQCFIYRNSLEHISLLQKIYDTLLQYGLRRDQNVVQFVLKENKYELYINYFGYNQIST
jgi:hypothetical protein